VGQSGKLVCFDHGKYFQLSITFTGQGYIIVPLAAELQKVSTQINCVLSIKGLFTHPISELDFAVISETI
jgi:hypothetical protein